eukprot:490458_1
MSQPSSVFKQMDATLNCYYIALQRNDYYSNEVGKFTRFCFINGIEANDIETELKYDIDDCLLVDFDKNFPFPESFKSEHDKLTRILEILKYCYKYQTFPLTDDTHLTTNDEICEGESNCPYLQRIMYSLQLYHKLVSENNIPSGKHTFIQFCNNSYKKCVDDYTHLICVHSNDLNKITSQLEAHYSVTQCNNVDQCKMLQRHYRDRSKNEEYKTDNDEDDFYIELFDTIHFYLFHLKQLGLRISNSDESNYNDNDDDNLQFIDKEIVFIRNEIEIKCKRYGSHFDRISNDVNSKFIIQQTGQNITTEHENKNMNKDDICDVSDTNEEQKTDENTFIDNI